MTKIFTKPSFKTAGIDGDVLVYRAAFKAQYLKHELVAADGTVLRSSGTKKLLKEWSELAPGVTTIRTTVHHLNPKNATDAFTAAVKEVQKNTNADKVVIYLSGETNFRIAAAVTKPYKGTRLAERPTAWQDVRDHAIANYPHVVSDMCEADDLLAIGQTRAWTGDKKDEDFIICTIDKDLMTVPGWHYHLTKRKILWQEPFDAYRFFYKQMLMGDNTDNIQGLLGVGTKTADNVLANALATTPKSSKHKAPTLLEEAVISQYKIHHKANWYFKFIEMGRLLHMQRSKDELWQPLTQPLKDARYYK